MEALALTFLPLSTQSVQKVLSLNPKLARTSKEKCPNRSGNQSPTSRDSSATIK
jgi:hypothetical protein